MFWIWICIGLLLVAGALRIGFSWAADRGHQALERAARLEGPAVLAGPRDSKLKPVPIRIRTIQSLGSLSAFDDYMAESAGG